MPRTEFIYRPIYEPDMNKMVQALKILLEFNPKKEEGEKDGQVQCCILTEDEAEKQERLIVDRTYNAAQKKGTKK